MMCPNREVKLVERDKRRFSPQRHEGARNRMNRKSLRLSLSAVKMILVGCLFLSTTSKLQAQTKSVVSGVEPMEYTNPILAGFYPDPSICRVGDDYYLVNSTFAYYPGITVFRSKDLVNWKLIGYVIDRPDQVKTQDAASRYDSLGVSRGIFAPAIRYHDGLFYVTCTFVDGGGNFVCTAKNPAGPWSQPVWLPQVSGIDPSLFFDDNGKAYLTYNSVAPDNKPLYEGHRTIRMRGFDIDRLRVLDDERILVNGGSDISKKPIWIEGPHIFKKDGTYYLICAEGGTAEGHSEVVFKSENVNGPYVSYKDNPILTQRDLSPNRKDPITCTGHADFVETQNGAWWTVFLGCQPYNDDYFNTGRETFLVPVTWNDGWPSIVPHDQLVKIHYPYPLPSSEEKSELHYGGNFEYTDNFDAEVLDLDWEFLRVPHEKWYNLTDKPGFLSIQLRPETCSGNMNPSFLGRRQQHAECSASVAMEFLPAAENEKAGLVVFQNESHYYFLCKGKEDGKQAIQLFRSVDTPTVKVPMQLLASQTLSPGDDGKEISLKIEAHGNLYSFLYSLGPNKWSSLKDSIDGTYLSTKVAGGFVGCMFALYATSLGNPSESKAYFDWFKYKGDNEVYRK